MENQKAEEFEQAMDTTTLVVVDGDGNLFVPAEDAEGRIVLAECALVMSKEEYEEEGIETSEELEAFIEELADSIESEDSDSEEEDEASDAEDSDETNDEEEDGEDLESEADE